MTVYSVNMTTAVVILNPQMAFVSELHRIRKDEVHLLAVLAHLCLQ